MERQPDLSRERTGPVGDHHPQPQQPQEPPVRTQRADERLAPALAARRPHQRHRAGHGHEHHHQHRQRQPPAGRDREREQDRQHRYAPRWRAASRWDSVRVDACAAFRWPGWSTSMATPTTMSESATLNVGQWYRPRYQSMKSIT